MTTHLQTTSKEASVAKLPGSDLRGVKLPPAIGPIIMDPTTGFSGKNEGDHATRVANWFSDLFADSPKEKERKEQERMRRVMECGDKGAKELRHKIMTGVYSQHPLGRALLGRPLASETNHEREFRKIYEDCYDKTK